MRRDSLIVSLDCPAMIIGLVKSLACGHLVSWVYMLTPSELSNSQNAVRATSDEAHGPDL
jgi:hypothetical protein